MRRRLRVERDVRRARVREVADDAVHGRHHEVHVDGRRDAVLAQGAADHGTDGEVRHVVVVHDVKVHDVRARGQRVDDLLAEAREVGAEDRRRDEEVLVGLDELHAHRRLGRGSAEPRERLGRDERRGGRRGESEEEFLHDLRRGDGIR